MCALFISDAMHIIISDICSDLFRVCLQMSSTNNSQGFPTDTTEWAIKSATRSFFYHFFFRLQEQKFQFSTSKRAQERKDEIFLRFISPSRAIPA